MRRLLGALLVVGLAALVVVLFVGGSGGGGDQTPRYTIELDNAFGLIEGGDFKVAGVAAGKIERLHLDRKTKRALVDVSVSERGFGSLRRDVRCNVAPQSIIGEYFVNCVPGSDPQQWDQDERIPVERTTTTVPPDLVGNIMRRPYRERLSFVVSSLGAAVAGNADNLNAAIRRGVPALRETNRVLAILARQNQVLADLAKNADTVLADLAEKRTDVSRFVVEARDTARASAERDVALAEGFRRLPDFLRELRPTMLELGRTADAQGPALQNLSRSAEQLERLFDNLGPFADASRPAIDALGEASKIGAQAARAATPTVDELDRYARGTPELGKNLAIVLEHLDDREKAAEPDPRSPGGKGYTGLEALLQYVFDQTLAINIHDGETHILQVFPFEGECAAYADIERAKEVEKHCSAALGPNRVGVTFPDATAPAGYDGADRGPESSDRDPSRSAARSERDRGDALALPDLGRILPGGGSSDGGGSGERPPEPLVKELPKLPAPQVPGAPATPQAPTTKDDQQAKNDLLDFLLGS